MKIGTTSPTTANCSGFNGHCAQPHSQIEFSQLPLAAPNDWPYIIYIIWERTVQETLSWLEAVDGYINSQLLRARNLIVRSTESKEQAVRGDSPSQSLDSLHPLTPLDNRFLPLSLSLSRLSLSPSLGHSSAVIGRLFRVWPGSSIFQPRSPSLRRRLRSVVFGGPLTFRCLRHRSKSGFAYNKKPKARAIFAVPIEKKNN